MKSTTTLPEAVSNGKGLLDKAKALELELPSDLERLAIARGCNYYMRDLAPFDNAEGVAFSNAELAIALLIVTSPPEARSIRLAAAMLGASDVAAEDVVKLAVEEDCSAIVRYIAAAGARFEPGNSLWKSLLGLLPEAKVELDNLPHPTRFVEMTGIERGKVGTTFRWVRPQHKTNPR